MFSTWTHNPRTALILSLVCLAVTVSLLIGLIVYLDVKPGHKHRIFNNQPVVLLKLALWGAGIVGGVLLGWGRSLNLRLAAGPDAVFRRRAAPVIFGILLCLWSIERLILGISPVGTYDYLGAIGIKPPGIWYGFDAVVAALIMIPTAVLGAYFIAKGLIPAPRDEAPET